MPNVFKYSAGATPSGCLRRGNMLIGNNTADYGSTFYSGISPSVGGYTIYQNKASGGPSIYSIANDSDLVTITNTQVAGSVASPASYTTAAQCLDYFAGQSDKLCINQDYEGIVTDLLVNVDAGFTPSYPKSGTSWYDLSGNNYNGTLSNGPTFNSSNGGSIVFDGSDDYVTINSGSSILSNVNYTKIAWFYPTNFATSNNIISGGNTGQHAFWLFASNKLNAGHNGVWNTVVSTTTLSLNTWYCGAVTFNTTNGWKLYLNGSQEATSSNTTTFTGTGDIQIGRYQTGNNYTGRIAIAQVYNRVLSAAEILQNFNAQKSRFGL